MLENVTHIAETYGAIGVFVVLVLCSFGFPFSKSLTIVAGGILAGVDRSQMLLLFAAATLGLHTGDFILFSAGRRWGEDVFRSRFVRRIAPPVYMERAREFVSRYGTASILLARVVPFIRSACYIMLGTLKMSPLKFTLINVSVSAVYAAIFFGIGFQIGNHPEKIMAMLRSGNVLFVIAAVGLALALIYWRRRGAFPGR